MKGFRKHILILVAAMAATVVAADSVEEPSLNRLFA